MAKWHTRTPTEEIDESPATRQAAVAAVAPEDLAARKEVARYLLDPANAYALPALLPPETEARFALAAKKPMVPFPEGLRPTPAPAKKVPDPSARLKPADVLVVTWTVAEQDALADVLTPGFGRKAKKGKNSVNIWYPYDRNYVKKFMPNIRGGAPSRRGKMLGSWQRCTIGQREVLCFKSELHLNQDGIRDREHPGTATLPVRDLFSQLLDEVQPEIVLTVGTSGGVFSSHDLGDVVVTRAAKFRLQDEFKNETFNHKKFVNDWKIPTKHFPTAVQLMKTFAERLVEPAFGPPTKRYPFQGALLKPSRPNAPDIKLEGVKLPGQDEAPMPKFHPILTTDYFEYGTSANHLDQEGCAVEMGDAVLGLVCKERADAPNWAVVRNLSDPVINADLPTLPRPLNMQTHWAVWYYQTFGYWTSVMSALATWAVIAGLD
jgi:hypothetical protein